VWSEKVNPKTLIEEQSFLYRALKTGQLACVLSFVMNIFSNSIYFWLLDGTINFVQYGYLSSVTNLLSGITSILLAIGYYALLRSNRSRLALPYVFLFLIPYAIP
jgi:hypothetical protein